MPSPPHVFFATASYRKPVPQYLASLDRTARLLEGAGWQTTLQIVHGDCYVQHARNTLLARFMASGATDILFLDDDVAWPAEAALKLLEMPDPVAFGVYPMKREAESYPVVIHTDPDGYPLVRADGCIAGAGAPAGFLRIKRGVIEALQAAHPGLAYDEYDSDGAFVRRAFDLFPQGARGGRWWGEDFAFCNLWAAAGGELWCVPDIDFGHVAADGKVYRGNYHRYLMNRPRHDAA